MSRDTRGGRMDTGDSQKAVSQEAITSQHAKAHHKNSTDRADIANAVHRGDLFMKLKRMRGFIETYEYNADGNWLGYTPDESSVRDRQLWH